MTASELARAAADEMSSVPNFELTLPTPYAVLLTALVQVTLRNPELDPRSPAAEAGRAIVAVVRECFAGFPATQALIDKGGR